ncbi:hypothetical protein ACFLS9_07935 [Bacteroidota bacterium]
MIFNNLPYNRLETIIKENLCVDRDKDFEMLSKKTKVARKRGYLTKSGLIEICKWKSPRALYLIHQNTGYIIKKESSTAFSSRDEIKKILALTKLRGVGLPMASSVLTMSNPQRYGVIDVRVWQILYMLKMVTNNPSGVRFTIKDWQRFLKIIRIYAKKLNVRARDIELTLFYIHKDFQKDLLYK